MAARRSARRRTRRGQALRAISLPPSFAVSFAVSIAAASGLVVRERARRELRGFAAEQAALRRVATLVARAAPPEEVFGAVVSEVGQLLAAPLSQLNRYDPEGSATTVVGAWANAGSVVAFPVGIRWHLGGRNVSTLVRETGRTARIDDYGDAAGEPADAARVRGIRSSVGVPITVEGRLWGHMSVASTQEQRFPANTEARLGNFAELVATAIANAESQAQLTASRARIVAAADDTRRRIERDLHDGAQQRLVALAMQLRAVQAAAPPAADGLREQLDDLVDQATAAVDELRELARGIHPAVLAEGGLRPVLRALARRSPVPVRLDVRGEGRLPEQVEIAAYYVVSEALTNAAKHAAASVVDVSVDVSGDVRHGTLHLRICDDGRGGADLSGGSGLVGLKDRVEALSGRLSVWTAIGSGTCVEVDLPLDLRSGLG
jgi:signal transduction histidine kinase